MNSTADDETPLSFGNYQVMTTERMATTRMAIYVQKKVPRKVLDHPSIKLPNILPSPRVTLAIQKFQ
jgi:hypothetical protein